MDENKEMNKIFLFLSIKSVCLHFWFTVYLLVNPTHRFDLLITEIYQDVFHKIPTFNTLKILLLLFFTLYLLYIKYLTIKYRLRFQQNKCAILLYTLSIFFSLEFFLDYTLDSKSISDIKYRFYEQYYNILDYHLFMHFAIYLQNNIYGLDLMSFLWLLIPSFHYVYSIYFEQYNNYSHKNEHKSYSLKTLKDISISVIRYYFNIILLITLAQNFKYAIWYIVSSVFFIKLKKKIENFYYYFERTFPTLTFIDIDLRRLENENEYTLIKKYPVRLRNYDLICVIIQKLSMLIGFSLIYEDIPVFNQNEILFQIVSVLMIFDLYYAFKHAYQQLIIPFFKGPQFVQCTTENQLENLILKYDSKELTQLKSVNINFKSELSYKALLTSFKNAAVYQKQDYNVKLKFENKWILNIKIYPKDRHYFLGDLLFNSLPQLSPEIETIFINELRWSQNDPKVFSKKKQIQLLYLSTSKKYPLYIYFDESLDIKKEKIIVYKHDNDGNNNKLVKEYEFSNNKIIYEKIAFYKLFGDILTYNPLFISRDLYY